MAFNIFLHFSLKNDFCQHDLSHPRSLNQKAGIGARKPLYIYEFAEIDTFLRAPKSIFHELQLGPGHRQP
jgi:hypothetical protein